MNQERLRGLLEAVRDGSENIESALSALRDFPYELLEFAALDHHRDLRQGIPEAVLCEGKSPQEAATITKRLAATGSPVLATRVDPASSRAILRAVPHATFHRRARVVAANARTSIDPNAVVVATAGTADLPVAEEAMVTATTLGSGVRLVCDVGVAGAHRLLSHLDVLRAARVVIVVAGMDGALPSLVGGLISQPVIAVPTSRGYGAHLGGIAALLTMLNSCAAGVAVMNIDNGFGAGVLAHRIDVMCRRPNGTGSPPQARAPQKKRKTERI